VFTVGNERSWSPEGATLKGTLHDSCSGDFTSEQSLKLMIKYPTINENKVTLFCRTILKNQRGFPYKLTLHETMIPIGKQPQPRGVSQIF